MEQVGAAEQKPSEHLLPKPKAAAHCVSLVHDVAWMSVSEHPEAYSQGAHVQLSVTPLRAKAKLNDPKKPLGSFLFLGP